MILQGNFCRENWLFFIPWWAALILAVGAVIASFFGVFILEWAYNGIFRGKEIAKILKEQKDLLTENARIKEKLRIATQELGALNAKEDVDNKGSYR